MAQYLPDVRPGLGATVLATLALSLVSALGGAPARAQGVVLNQVHTLAAATTGVPVEETFTVTTAGTYQVTLTDFGAALSPAAPLASVALAVTSSDDTIVGTPLSTAGTLTLTALAAGTYGIHVTGTPGNAPGSGPIGIVVTASDMTQVAAFQAVIALPNQVLPNGEAVLDDSFTVAGTGSYTISLNDLQLPQSLTTVALLLIPQGGTTPVVTLPNAGVYSATVSLSAGVTYDIFAVGEPNAASKAGLFSAVVSSGGSIVYGRAVAVGNTTHLGSPALAAGSYSLGLKDLIFPSALSQLGAALLMNGQPVVALSAAGSSTFNAAAGTYEAYGVATPASPPGAGSYSVEVMPQGGAPVFAVARGVTAAGGPLTAYSFDTMLTASGTDTVSLTDFQFPAVLSSVQLAAVEDGALLGTPLTAPGSDNIAGASGPLSVVVFAEATAAGGLFGVDVAPSGGGTAMFDVTQSVGTLFSATPLTITEAATYSVTATDLGFPAGFANYDTIVTQGTKRIGSIFGGGTFNFAATPGIYSVNFIAQPAGAAQAGTYALNIASAPPAPTVSLMVDHQQVSSGSSVDLIWSSQNATSCTASGGWSGSEPTSGVATSAPLTGDTTFTLVCSGAGGTTSQSVAVTVTAAAGKSGGGSLDGCLLAALAAALALVRRRKPPFA